MNQNKVFQNSSLRNAAEFYGEAGKLCCHSLLRTPISLLLQTPLTSRCGEDLAQGFGTAAVTPRRLYPSVGALTPFRKVSSRFQNPAQNISVTRPHIDRELRGQLYQALP